MENFNEFKNKLINNVMEKIKKGENLSSLDVLILQNKYEIYDPQVKAYRQVSLEDYYKYFKSLNK